MQWPIGYHVSKCLLIRNPEPDAVTSSGGQLHLQRCRWPESRCPRISTHRPSRQCLSQIHPGAIPWMRMSASSYKQNMERPQCAGQQQERDRCSTKALACRGYGLPASGRQRSWRARVYGDSMVTLSARARRYTRQLLRDATESLALECCAA